MKTYEVEIKSLLGTKENALKLKANLGKVYPDIKLIGQGKQLNHYFNTPKDFTSLVQKIEPIVPKDKLEEFTDIMKQAEKISLRTRDADGKIILVVKASLSGGTSSNGVTRREFECAVPLSLAKLDQVLLDGGATYQAKWSREREEYAAGDMHICFDKNAGYGYVAEFEKVVVDEKQLDQVKQSLLSAMDHVGASELPQDRLERMFAHYNAHWPEYYGTEKTFIVE